ECLENLDKIVAATETTDPGEDVAELRRLAEAERGKAHRRQQDLQRAHAEGRRAAADASRLRAQTADAALRASAVWVAAEAKMQVASAAFDDEVYSRAAQYYDEAIDLYGKAGAGALAAGRQGAAAPTREPSAVRVQAFEQSTFAREAERHRAEDARAAMAR